MQSKLKRGFSSVTWKDGQDRVFDNDFFENDAGVFRGFVFLLPLLLFLRRHIGPFTLWWNIDLHSIDRDQRDSLGRIEENAHVDFKGEFFHAKEWRDVGSPLVPQNDMLALNDALDELEPRQRQIVECRFFGGMEEEEIAESLGVSARTVRRDWVKARAWLYRALYGGTSD